MKNNKNNIFLIIDTHIRNYLGIYKLLSFIIAFISIIIIFTRYIDHEISKEIYSNQFRSTISEDLRPYLIINLENNIIADHGARNYIEKIEFYPDTVSLSTGKNFGFKIICKKPLSLPPVIENLSPHGLTFETKRFENLDWGVTAYITGYVERCPNDKSYIRIEIIF